MFVTRLVSPIVSGINHYHISQLLYKLASLYKDKTDFFFKLSPLTVTAINGFIIVCMTFGVNNLDRVLCEIDINYCKDNIIFGNNAYSDSCIFFIRPVFCTLMESLVLYSTGLYLQRR